jgi:DNA-binding transcriptional LysR family regulator
VRKLEEQLGVELLIRHGKQFSLTDAGDRIYSKTRDIILALSNLEQWVGEDPAFEGMVRVMSPGSVGLKLYPYLLALQSTYPKLIIDYRFAPNADVEKAIADAHVDIGFMTANSTLADVSCEPVGKEPLLLVTPVAVAEPSWDILMALGFIDHPDGSHHAGLFLGANYPEFHHTELVRSHRLPNPVSETLYLGVQRQKALQRRMQTVIAEAEKWL